MAPRAGRRSRRVRGVVPVTRLIGHVLYVLATMVPGSVHCVVTSPPFFRLREYGHVVAWPAVTWRPYPGATAVVIPGTTCELGREDDVGTYVAHIVLVLRALRRVLRPDGTAWVHLGDKYVRKSLVGVPDMVKLAAVADGWVHRADVVWHKTNPVPNSPADRPVVDHERVLVLAARRSYYYDREAVTRWHDGPDGRRRRDMRTTWTLPSEKRPGHGSTFPVELAARCVRAGTPLRACETCLAPHERVVEVWHENPGGRTTNGPRSTERRAVSPGFSARRRRATRTAGWRPGCDHDGPVVPGIVLDPFAGSGTVAEAAVVVGVSSVGIDMSSACQV